MLRLVMIAALAATAAEEPAEVPEESVAVHFGGQEVFRLRATVGGMSLQQRAAGIEARLQQLSAAWNPPELEVRDDPRFTAITAGKVTLTVVVDEDAKAEGTSRQELAAVRMMALSQALKDNSGERLLRRMVVAGAEALAATVVAALLLWALRRLFGALETRLERRATRDASKLKVGGLQLVGGEQLVRVLDSTLRAFFWVLALSVGTSWLSVVLRVFPQTRELAEGLTGLFIGPVKEIGAAAVGFLPNLIFIVVVGLVTRLLLAMIKQVFKGLESGTVTLRGFYPDWAKPTYNLVRMVILAFALMVMMPYLPGFGSAAFQAVGLFIGVLVSLGSSGAVSGAISGTMLMYMRPYRVGDFIQVGEVRGEVMEKSMLVTRLRTTRGEVVTITNSAVLAASVTNFSSEKAVAIRSSISIGYDVPWRRVHELMLEAAAKTSELVPHPPPTVFQAKLDDFYIVYTLQVFTAKPHVMHFTEAHLNEAIQDAFDRGGVQILSPHHRIDWMIKSEAPGPKPAPPAT